MTKNPTLNVTNRENCKIKKTTTTSFVVLDYILAGIEMVFCRLLVKMDDKGEHGLISTELT